MLGSSKLEQKEGIYSAIFSLTRSAQYIAIYWTRYLVHPKVISYWAGCLLGIANNRYYRDISISIRFLTQVDHWRITDDRVVEGSASSNEGGPTIFFK